MDVPSAEAPAFAGMTGVCGNDGGFAKVSLGGGVECVQTRDANEVPRILFRQPVTEFFQEPFDRDKIFDNVTCFVNGYAPMFGVN